MATAHPHRSRLAHVTTLSIGRDILKYTWKAGWRIWALVVFTRTMMGILDDSDADPAGAIEIPKAVLNYLVGIVFHHPILVVLIHLAVGLFWAIVNGPSDRRDHELIQGRQRPPTSGS